MNPLCRFYIYTALAFGIAYYGWQVELDARRGDQLMSWIGVLALVTWCLLVFVMTRPSR